MNKKSFVCIALIALSVVSFRANAQEIFQKGTKVVNAGIGIGSYIPVEAAFDYGIIDGLIKGENGAIGVGGYISWYGHSDSYEPYGSWRYNNFVLGVRGTFHYQFIPKLDTYGGLMLGYNIASSSWDGDDGWNDVSASASAFGFSAFVGGRYFFKPTLGVYGEFGYGIAFLSAGVTLKF
jgi:hypothetical protein